MIIFTEKRDQIRGDLIKRAVIRSSLVPVPMTLELEVRADADMAGRLAEGKVLEAGGIRYRVVKITRVEGRLAQGRRNFGWIRLIALLDACHKIAFVRETALIRSNTTLSAVYRAAGATFKQFEGDVPVPRFACFKGDYPSVQIANIMQEEGGVVAFKNNRVRFVRLPDLFRQRPVTSLPDNALDDVKSEFLERHGLPAFYSAAPDGGIVDGDDRKPRAAAYAPHKTARQLQNMTRCLVHRKRIKTSLNVNINAGDLIEMVGARPLVTITVAHVFEGGGVGDQYSKLWLGAMNE